MPASSGARRGRAAGSWPRLGVIERSTRPRLGGTASAVLGRPPPAGSAGVGPHGEEVQEIADVDHAAWDRPGSRHRQAAGNGRLCETGPGGRPRVVSAATATMSARGTMTSSTRMRWKPRTFFSIARSWGEKSGSSTVSARASSRSSRIESRDFNAESSQKALIPALARALRVRNSPGRAILTTSIFVHCKIISAERGTRSSCHTSVRIGDAQGGERLHLQTFHDFGLGLKLMVVAEEM